MKKGLFITSAMMLLLVFFAKYAVSGDQKAEGVSQEQIMQNIHRIQIPFIANNGQVDERVTFYANTFGGTVFVTNDGEIVYSLPKGSEAENADSRGERRTPDKIQQCSGEWHLPDVIHDAGCEIHDNGNLSIADRESCLKDNVSGIKPSILNSQSAIQNPQFEIHGVALKETLVGASAGKITGEQPAVTKVNYFKGSDPSKWKSNITTYDEVNLGEVYKGIELKLKAYGNNVEKLFYVKPGADPDQIKINLSGIQPPLSPFFKGDLVVSPSTIGSTDASQHSTAKPLLTMESITKSPSAKGSLAKSPLKKGGRGVVSPDESRASGLWINEQGQLVAETELGPVTFTKPVAYQEIDGKRVDVGVEYEIYAVPQVVHRKKPVLTSGRNAKNAKESIVGNTESAGNVCPPLAGVKGVERDSPHVIQPTTNPKSKIVNLSSTEIGGPKLEYGFKVASYDKTKELVIDPLLASTFLGGYSRDHGYSMAIDSNENVYIAGMSESSDFPTTTGTYQVSYKGYNSDAFVSKLNSDLTKLIASTYLGGSDYNDECIYSIAIDSEGNIYVTGQTSSSDFPITDGAYDITYNDNGYDYDAFVSKLNGDLTNLLASTYLGGYGRDQGGSIVIDSEEHIYVAGYTWASDFPSSSGAYQISYKSTGNNAFITKLSNDLKDVLASTYLGGETNSSSYSSGYFNYVDVALDSTGNLYITGYTNSSNFPVTTDAYDTSHNGNYDIFVSKLSKELTNLLASTYLGRSSGEKPNSIAIDTSGNIYIAGFTYSSDFPTTTEAYDNSYSGSNDAFISKLDSDLKNLIASTYLGGSGTEDAYSLCLDTSDNVYVCGYTTSSDFPTSADAYDTSYDLYDIFVSKLNNGLTSLLASTYLGGSNNDYAYSLSLSSENVFIGGYTTSSDFPTTIGVYDSSLHGEGSCFVSVFNTNLSDFRPTVKTDSATNITGSSAILNGTVNANGLTTTVWFEYGTTSDSYEYSSETVTEDSSDDTLVSIEISGLLAETTYYYRFVATNNDGTTYGDEMSFTTLSDTTKPSGSISINSGNSYTNSSNVTVKLSASDDVGITGYYISTNSSTPSSSTSGWTSISSTTNYSANISYTLDGGDGSKTIYVWYEDDADNISDTYSDSIILDTTPPEINITSPTTNDTYSTNISVISIWGNASDATSGISTVKWENNKGGSGTATGTTSWSISNIGLLVDAENIITVTTTDNAGNSASDSITVTYSELTAEPTATSTPTPIQVPTSIIVPTSTPTSIPTVTPRVSPTLPAIPTNTLTPAPIPISTPKITPTPLIIPTPVKVGAILGSVVDTDGKPVANATVFTDKGGYSAKTGSNGIYQLNDVAEGSYLLTALAEGYGSVSQTITVEAGETTQADFTLLRAITPPTPVPSLSPSVNPIPSTTPTPSTLSGKIFGYVMDEIDNPVKKAKVRCKGKNTSVKENATTNKQGYFEFNNLSADSYKITAKKKGFNKSKYNVNLDPGEEKEVEIVLEEK